MQNTWIQSFNPNPKILRLGQTLGHVNFAANSSIASRTQNINDLQLSQRQIYDERERERERESFKYGVPGNLCMQLSGKGKMMSSSLNNFANGTPM